MTFLTLEPFVPSGNNFEGASQLFQELGFAIHWDAGDYIGFKTESCAFILQKFANRDFAENLMIRVGVADAEVFRRMVHEKQLPERFGIRVGPLTQQAYGKEVNLIDMAGVCWHFVES